MTDVEIKYEQLKQAVSKMLAAQAEARKNKSIQQKWVIANKLEHQVKEMINPTPKENKTSQATFEFLAR